MYALNNILNFLFSLIQLNSSSWLKSPRFLDVSQFIQNFLCLRFGLSFGFNFSLTFGIRLICRDLLVFILI